MVTGERKEEVEMVNTFFPTVTEIKKSNTMAQLTIREFVTLINASSVDPRLLYSSLLFPFTPVPTYLPFCHQ